MTAFNDQKYDELLALFTDDLTSITNITNTKPAGLGLIALREWCVSAYLKDRNYISLIHDS